GGHEEPVARSAAEAEVGTALWEDDLPDHRRVRGEDMHSVVAIAATGRSSPDVAVTVAANAVGDTVSHVDELPSALHAVTGHLVDADHPRRGTGVDDVEQRPVWREA